MGDPVGVNHIGVRITLGQLEPLQDHAIGLCGIDHWLLSSRGIVLLEIGLRFDQ